MFIIFENERVQFKKEISARDYDDADVVVKVYAPGEQENGYIAKVIKSRHYPFPDDMEFF